MPLTIFLYENLKEDKTIIKSKNKRNIENMKQRLNFTQHSTHDGMRNIKSVLNSDQTLSLKVTFGNI